MSNRSSGVSQNPVHSNFADAPPAAEGSMSAEAELRFSEASTLPGPGASAFVNTRAAAVQKARGHNTSVASINPIAGGRLGGAATPSLMSTQATNRSDNDAQLIASASPATRFGDFALGESRRLVPHTSPLSGLGVRINEISSPLFESITIWAAIAVGAYLGTLIRIGFSYYRGWQSPANFSVMYAQVLGCVIMGVASEFQATLMTAGRRAERLLYIFITTGLCGSITTFSTWHYEAAKLLMMQFDMSYQSLGRTYNGGSFFDWIIALWVGFVLPLAALHGGMHLAQMLKDACKHRGRVRTSASANKSNAASTVAQPTTNSVAGSSAPSIHDPAPSAASSIGSSATTSQSEPASRIIGTVAATTAIPSSSTIGIKRGPAPPWHGLAELCVLVIYVLFTVVLIVFPVTQDWPVITAAVLLGSLGAYIRYLLSRWNKGVPSLERGWGCFGWIARTLRLGSGAFPVGTFTANVVGTWVLAAAALLSKIAVSYHDHAAQAALYGVIVGFCGCLTTMSTFVLELHRLPRSAGYCYAAVSYFVAQVGLVLIVMTPLAAIAAAVIRSPARIDMCAAYVDVCGSLLSSIGCPPSLRIVSGCSPFGPSGPVSFRGKCVCGLESGSGFDASGRVTELLIDAQTLSSVRMSLVALWPSSPDGGPWTVSDAAQRTATSITGYADPTAVIDLCGSYENICDGFLEQIGCPADERKVMGCAAAGLSMFRGECTCSGFTVSSSRVTELILDQLLQRRYDLLPYAPYVTVPTPLDFCGAFEVSCSAMLNHIACPPRDRVSVGCTAPGDYSTYQGTCTCFGDRGFTAGSERVRQTLMDAFSKPMSWSLIAKLPALSNGSRIATVDACVSYDVVCTAFFARIGCPAGARRTYSCDAAANATIYGPPPPGAAASPATFGGVCECGSLSASNRVAEYVIDAVAAGALVPYTFIPPPQQPFTLIASSNPYRQLLDTNPLGPPGSEA